jgi:hypothetical protein
MRLSPSRSETYLHLPCLLRSYKQRQPINNVIDAISTYVGHAKVSDTYWYVTATPELMAVAAQRFSQFAEGVAR